MALYALGDPHLSLTVEKPMDIFGGAWEGYVDKLKRGLSVLTPEDTLVLCGDLSWGMDLQQAREDFAFLDSFPGRKFLIKGNHDYWWTTAAKMEKFFQQEGFSSFQLLHNNCRFYGDTALCGTRGWSFDEEEEGDRKVFARELVRLETSLKAAGDAEKICFLHYPPFRAGRAEGEFVELMERYGVRTCCYGHLHGDAQRTALTGEHGGIRYILVAADAVGFKPVRILP